MPEFMGRRFGQSTRNILAWYTIVTILISWLALTLFAGGILIRQVFDIPMWQSALILLVISAFFTMAGGLKAVAYTNVFQMLLLIFVSATLTIAGLYKVGGVSALAEAVPADYWNLFRPNDDPAFPWLPIILGYPIMGVWFWCTDQSMVQPVLAAKNLKEGQMGANFTGWLKILDVPLYILPGIICLALYPGLKNPDEAYMTMVTNLFPVGMVGLVLALFDRVDGLARDPSRFCQCPLRHIFFRAGSFQFQILRHPVTSSISCEGKLIPSGYRIALIRHYVKYNLLFVLYFIFQK